MKIVQCVLLVGLFIDLTQLTTGQECGRAIHSSDYLEGKIVGGYDVGYYKYPWYAVLMLDDTAWCGGTLIGPKTIISAAHCFKTYLHQKPLQLEKVYKVRLGVYNQCKKESTQKQYNVEKVIVHEKYVKKQPYYDICLLILDKDTTGFEPACLPQKPLIDSSRGREGIIIGLGTIKYNVDKSPCTLNEGRVLIYEDGFCKQMIRNATNDVEDYPLEHAFCAGYKEGGVDACQGDSGGPFLVVSPTNRYILLGLTSFGYDCAQKDLLGIYTDVSHYGDWIENKTGLKSLSAEAPTTTTTAAPTTPTPMINTVNYQSIPPFTQQPPITWNYPMTLGPQYFFPPLQNSWWHHPPKRIIFEFRNNKKKKKKPHHPHRRRYGHRALHRQHHHHHNISNYTIN